MRTERSGGSSARITFHCGCGRQLRVKQKYDVKRIQCPACGGELLVPVTAQVVAEIDQPTPETVPQQAEAAHPPLFYRRVKTGKTFYRPMNRVVHVHIRSILPDDPRPHDPVFFGGGSRPNRWFRELCRRAGIRLKTDVETGEQKPWLLKYLRKTCATYYDAHVPESSIEVLGHSVAGVTYRHDAHRDPSAFRAIMTLPQPSAFTALVKGYDGQCPCCRRALADAS